MKTKLISTIVAFLLVFTASLRIPAQTGPAPVSGDAHFEVASVRMVDSRPHPIEDLMKGIGLTSFSTYPTNRFFAHNASLKALIAIAYDVDGKDIRGNDWLDSQNYDVEAKVEDEKELGYDQMKPLLQHLLEERFHLTTHRMAELTSGYALIIAKGGPKLKSSKAAGSTYASIYPNGLQFPHSDLKNLAAILSHPIGAPVVDKTGIAGSYDIQMSYAPADDPNSSLPSIFTALQEQLGLKLESQKVPVEYLVIVNVERTPTEN